MKKIFLLLCIYSFCTHLIAQQGVAVNTDGTAPHSSAILDVKSTNKGMLVPRVLLLSPTDVVTIPSAAKSLLVFNTNTNKSQMPDGEGFYYWDFVLLGTSSWKPVSTLPTKVSSIESLGCNWLTNVTTTYQKINDLGTFIKSNTNTDNELILQTNLNVIAFNASSGVVFELRVDDEAAQFGNGVAFVRETSTYFPVSITGIFTRLVSGAHTVSLWARTINGSATGAYYNLGCTSGVSSVLIKEFR